MSTDREAIPCLDLLAASRLQQHITVPTHKDGHTLDLLITRSSDDSLTSNISVNEGVSVHDMITCSLELQRPCAPKKSITTRNIKSIDSSLFCNDIKNSVLLRNYEYSSVMQNVDNYNNCLSSVLHIHAPSKNSHCYSKIKFALVL